MDSTKIDQKQAAFMKAYEGCHLAFTRYCSALTYGKMEMEDLIQDVLLSAYQHFEHIHHKERLLHYLIRAARNRSISQWKKKKLRTELLEQHSERLMAQGIGVEEVLDIQFLYQLLEQLPKRRKDVIILFEICGFKIKEIAEIQKRTEGAIKMDISRGRKQLREMVKEEDRSYVILAVFGSDKDEKVLLADKKLDQLFEKARIHISTFDMLRVKEILKKSLFKGEQIRRKNMDFYQSYFSLTSSGIGLICVSVCVLGVLFFPSLFKNYAESSSFPLAYQLLLEEGPHLALHKIPVLSASLHNPSVKKTSPKLVNDWDDIRLTSGEYGNGRLWRGEDFRDTSHAFLQRMKKGLSTSSEMASLSLDAKAAVVDRGQALIITDSQLGNGCDGPLNIVGNVDLLKERLLYHLKQDQLIRNKNKSSYIIFLSESIWINENQLPPILQDKYIQMIKRYNIYPCVNRVFVLQPDYFWVIDPEDYSEFYLPEFVKQILHTQGAVHGKSLLETEAQWKEVCEEELNVQGNIRNLRRKLRKYFKQDGVYRTGDGKDRLLYRKEGIWVNKRPIAPTAQEKYVKLFQSYQIKPCPFRIFELSPDYILVGDVEENADLGRLEIKGQIKGSIDLSHFHKEKPSDIEPEEP